MTEALAPPQSSKHSPAETPFVGLVPYGEGDAAFFFGRDDEKEIITANLRAARLTILYGASGVGKTSVLHAGVVHDLHEQVRENVAGRTEREPFAICTFSSWRNDPMSALAEVMRAACVEALGGEELPHWQRGGSFVEAVRGWTERVRPLLVVLDQFEEYFLYHAAEGGEGTFAVEFPRLVNEPNLRVNFVLSLREDAWAKLDRFEDSIPALFENYVRIEHLDRKAARKAIDEPVGVWNDRLPHGEEHYVVEPELREAVIEAAAAGTLGLSEGGDGAAPQEASTDAVEAPFLQLVLERLWRETVADGGHTVDLARLKALGGAQQIVDDHLLEALGKLTPDEQAVAADLFRFLVTRSKTKIAHPATDLAEWTKRPEPEVTAVLDKLCLGESGRILRSISPPAGETTGSYELFHDVLAEPILDWRKEYEQQRDQEAEAQRLREEQDAEAQRLREEQEAATERGRRRRLRRLVVVFVLTTLAFGALGLWALKLRTDAVHATASAKSVALASASNDQLATRFDASLLLSLEAYRARQTAQAKGSMISALEAFRRSGARAILTGGQRAVAGVAFSPDGSTLAASGADGEVVLWNAAHDYTRLTTLDSGQRSVVGVAFSPDGSTLAAAGTGGKVVLWDAAHNYKRLTALDSGQRSVRGVAFSPDGSTLAGAGASGKVVLWDAGHDYSKLRTLISGQGSVLGVAFSPVGSTLAAAGGAGKVVLWDAAHDYRKLGALNTGQSAVFGVAYSPDGRTLAAAGGAGEVVLWDAAHKDRRLTALKSGQRSVRGVAFSRDGSTLAAGGGAGEVVLWDAKHNYSKLTALESGQRSVRGVAFNPTRSTLAAAGVDGEVALWDAAHDYSKLTALESGEASVNGVAFRPGRSTLAATNEEGQVVLWDPTRDYGKLRALTSGEPSMEGVAFSPDGSTLAAGGAGGRVVLWDAARDYHKLKALSSGQSSVYGIAFSPDGSKLAASGGDGKVVLWDVAHGYKKLPALNSRQDSVWWVAFSPDGSTLAATGPGGKVVLWDVAHGYRKLKALSSGQGYVFGITFSPDGSTLAAASDHGKVVLWDAAHDYARLTTLDSAQSSVIGVAYSPDGSTLGAAGHEGKLMLWDAAHDYTKLATLDSGQGSIYRLAFSRNGSTLAAAGSDGKVVLWDIFWHDFSDLKAKVCGLVHGNLTKTEWETFAPGLSYSTTCPN